MKSKKHIVVFGSGGHSTVIQDLLLELGWKITAIVVPKASQKALEISETDFLKSKKPVQVAVAIGDNHLRQLIVERIQKSIPALFPTLIHPTAHVSKNAFLEEGVQVMAGAIVQSQARVAAHCIINTGSLIEHDCVLEKFSSIGPRAAVAGNVRIGMQTHIGLNACVLQNLTIGSNTVIGAGSVVTKNISSNEVAYGVPCKPKRKSIEKKR